MPRISFNLLTSLRRMSSQLRPLQWMLFFLTIYLVLISSVSWYRESENENASAIYGSFSEEKDVPILFIGGCPRSGTTLMRVLLDTHPQISCGPETHILPKLLSMHTSLSVYDQTRMQMAGIDKDLQNLAMRDFIFDIIMGHVKRGSAPSNGFTFWPCNKDPFLLNNAIYLKRLFPKAKFIHMVR